MNSRLLHASRSDNLLSLRARRFFAVLMSVLTIVPSFAEAAASTLVQEPPFTATVPAANVFMMLDDSSSMGLHELPMSSDIINLPTALTVTVSGEGGDEAGNWSTRPFNVHRDNEWVLRSPALNPLWYNPATTYTPWEDDGRTTFVNAKIGGSVVGSSATTPGNVGFPQSRPDNLNLTERDMRYIPGTTTKLDAGGGAWGTWDNYSDAESGAAADLKKVAGRLITKTSPSMISFRYYGMPLERGIAGIANNLTTATDTDPLDLFMRPIRTLSGTSNTGCYAGVCSGSAVAKIWTRRNCLNTMTTSYMADPGSLTCYTRNACVTNTPTPYDADPGSIDCKYTRRTTCDADATTDYTTNPGNLTCWQIRSCMDVVSYSTTRPTDITCQTYGRRTSCSDATIAYTATSPPALTCYSRRTSCMDGSTTQFTTDPGTLPCGGFTRRASCTDATPVNTGTDPGTLNCWQRVNCLSGNTEYFASDPGPATCSGYVRRTNCTGTGTTDYGVSSPGPLGCYQQRTSCTDSTIAYYATPQTTLNCGFTRRTSCTDATTANYGSDPGTLNCWTRQAACGSGTSQTYTTDPGTLTCYTRRISCADAGTQQTTTNPGSFSCPFQRNDCAGATQNFATDPGSLTCYSRQDCAGTNTAYGATTPGSLQCYSRRTSCSDATTAYFTPTNPGSIFCVGEGEAATEYATTAFTRNPTSSTNNVSGGGTYNVTTNSLTTTFNAYGSSSVSYASSNATFNVTAPVINNSSTIAFAPTPPTYYAVTPITYNPTPPVVRTATFDAIFGVTPDTHASSSFVVIPDNVCPASTTQQTCATSGSVTGPDSRYMTPARYYKYKGTGDKANPVNYTLVQIDRTRAVTGTTAYLYPVVDATTGAAATRADCALGNRCTWREEAQNFANWHAYYSSRLYAAVGVISQSMTALVTTSQQALRIGYGRVNNVSGAKNPWNTGTTQSITPAAVDGFANPGALVRGVRPFVLGTPDRRDLFNWLFSLGWTGPTPTREAIDSVGRYFTYGDNRGPWGRTPGTNDTTAQVTCRRNYAMLTTDGEWTNVPAGQPILSSTGPTASDSSSLDIGGSNPTNADGIVGPTMYGSGASAGVSYAYDPALNPQFSGGSSGQTRTFTDLTMYYWDRDLRPDLNNTVRPITDPARKNPSFWQSMSTYVIGYGLNASMDTPANRAAILAGTSVNWPIVAGVGTDTDNTVITGGNRVNDAFRAAVASRGNFYAALSISALKSSFTSTFSDLDKREGAAGGIAVSSPIITADTLAFLSGYVTGDWTGTLKGYVPTKLDALNAGIPTPADWNATLPAATSRNILTSTGRQSSGENFMTATSLTTFQQGALAANGKPAQEVLNYLRGDQSLELATAGGTVNPIGKFRTRTGLLGDIVNSTPIYSKGPDFGYAYMPDIGTGSYSGDYRRFYTTYLAHNRLASGGRQAAVYVGANDGMFHAFGVTSTGTSGVYQPGNELFAYVPRASYLLLSALAEAGYQHNYYVDGQVTQGDAYFGSIGSGTWRSIVVGSSGAGPASLFAIDVSDPNNVTKSQVLWDLTQLDAVTNTTYLGHVLGTGVIGRVRTGTNTYKWVYIVGNGVESISNQAALLVIDIQTGDITAIPVGPTWTDGVDAPEARNGMGGVGVIYDPAGNINLVYAGDKQGNLWKFNFTSGIPTYSTGAGGLVGTRNQALFTATDAANKRQPITAAPRVALHGKGGYYVLFGTGKLYDLNDTSNSDTQALYGVWDSPSASTKIVKTDLVPKTFLVASDKTRSFDTTVAWSATVRGWYVNLRPATTTSADSAVIGERVVADPTLDGALFAISSFAPGATVDPCEGGGLSYIYVINLITGKVTAIPTTGTVAGPAGWVTAGGTVAGSNTTGVSHLNGSLGNSGASSLDGTPTTGSGGGNCQYGSLGITGQPSLIAQKCPSDAPLRVWRQPLR